MLLIVWVHRWMRTPPFLELISCLEREWLLRSDPFVRSVVLAGTFGILILRGGRLVVRLNGHPGAGLVLISWVVCRDSKLSLRLTNVHTLLSRTTRDRDY